MNKEKIAWDSLDADDQKAFRAFVRSRRGKRMAQLPVTSSEEAARELFDRWPRVLQEKQEVMVAMFLDNSGRVVAHCELSRGHKTGTILHPRMVMERMFRYPTATSMILAHNHLSGAMEPSDQDMDMTRKMQGVCDLMGVQILDHLIVGRSSVGTPAIRSVMDYMKEKGRELR